MCDLQLINSVYLDNSSCELYHGRLDKKPGALALRVRWWVKVGCDVIWAFLQNKREMSRRHMSTVCMLCRSS